MSLDRPETDRELDVRTIDGEPFSDIVSALESLPEDESLLLINSFEPKPLYEVLEARGFSHETSNPEPDLWHVTITHD
ncbi:MAG: DUF2249 domain-containing protein [Natronomonas sp.]